MPVFQQPSSYTVSVVESAICFLPSLRFREAELIHGRWCMLAVAGMLSVELLGFGNWVDAPLSVRTLPVFSCGVLMICWVSKNVLV